MKFSISAQSGTSYYFRAVFYKEGSSNYCGLTWNGSSFYSGPYTTNEGWKNFLKVTINDNSWEGEIKAKIDSEDSGCKESGGYLFKMERFTESGSGSFDPQDVLTFTFTLPSPTPLPTPTLKPTPTTHITTSAKTIPAKVSTITQTSSVQNATQENELSTPNPHYLDYESSEEEVLGDATQSAEENISVTPTPMLLVMKSEGKKSSLTAIFFSTIGLGMLILCAILAIRTYKRNQRL